MVSVFDERRRENVFGASGLRTDSKSVLTTFVPKCIPDVTYIGSYSDHSYDKPNVWKRMHTFEPCINTYQHHFVGLVIASHIQQPSMALQSTPTKARRALCVKTWLATVLQPRNEKMRSVTLTRGLR